MGVLIKKRNLPLSPSHSIYMHIAMYNISIQRQINLAYTMYNVVTGRLQREKERDAFARWDFPPNHQEEKIAQPNVTIWLNRLIEHKELKQDMLLNHGFLEFLFFSPCAGITTEFDHDTD